VANKGRRCAVMMRRSTTYGFETQELQSSPLAWIASRRFPLPHDGVVPLALLDSSDVFRRTAVRTLDQAKRPWRADSKVPPCVGFAPACARASASPRISLSDAEVHDAAGIDAPRSPVFPPSYRRGLSRSDRDRKCMADITHLPMVSPAPISR
jgi:hypothetical protein